MKSAAAAAATAAEAQAEAAPTEIRTPTARLPTTAVGPEAVAGAASFGDGVGPGNININPPTSPATPITDDALLPSLDDVLDDDGNQIVLEPVWVEGETEGEKPIVETYGLNDALATAEDGIDIDNGMMIDPDDADEALLIPTAGAGASIGVGGALAGGLADGAGPESWRNGMEVPDDDVVLGERFNMVGRGLDDMLMERSIRFYDPKVTRTKNRRVRVRVLSGLGLDVTHSESTNKFVSLIFVRCHRIASRACVRGGTTEY